MLGQRQKRWADIVYSCRISPALTKWYRYIISVGTSCMCASIGLNTLMLDHELIVDKNATMG